MNNWTRRWVEGVPPLRRRLLLYLVFGGGGAWFAGKVVLALQSGTIETKRGYIIQRATNPEAFQTEMYLLGAMATLSLLAFAFFLVKDIMRQISK